MARKLALGLAFCLSAALVGCQTGAGSRLAANKNTSNNPFATNKNSRNSNQNAVAAQNTLPPPNFPTANGPDNSFRNPTQGNQGASNITPTNAAFPQTATNVAPVGNVPSLPNLPAPGPQPFGANNTTNRITQPSPGPDLVMPPLPPQNELQRPGISPIPVPQ